MGANTLALVAGAPGGGGAADGVGTNARVNGPSGLATDGNGHLFIADQGNRTIRRVDLVTKQVTTIAGATYDACAPTSLPAVDGIGVEARFLAPADVAVGSDGNLYVADAGDYTLRRVGLATGRVSTLAGEHGVPGSDDGVGVAAHFVAPTTLSSDDHGNLYVGDSEACTIRKVDLATATVTTLAGSVCATGTVDGIGREAGFATVANIAVGGSSLYVAGGRWLRKLDLGTTEVTTAYTGPGTLNTENYTVTYAQAMGVAVDGPGTVYFGVKELGGCRLVGIDAATGDVATAAELVGSFPRGYDIPSRVLCSARDLAADRAGNVYVIDSTDAFAVYQVQIAAGSITRLVGSHTSADDTEGTGTDARFYQPGGVAVVDDATDGAVAYVADTRYGIIRRVVLASGQVTDFAGAQWSRSVDGIGQAAGFWRLSAITAAGDGTLYVLDLQDDGHSLVRRIDVVTAGVTTLSLHFLDPGYGAVASWSDLTADTNGYLYVSDVSSEVVARIDAASGNVTTIPVLGGPTDVLPLREVADGLGNLYFSSLNCIGRLEIASGLVTIIAGDPATPPNDCEPNPDGIGVSARFSVPSSLALDGKGALFVVDGPTVRKVDLQTTAVTTVIGNPRLTEVMLGPLPAALHSPGGLALTRTGDLVITDVDENAVLLARLSSAR
jgi:sugar lactone lactonase YvrE